MQVAVATSGALNTTNVRRGDHPAGSHTSALGARLVSGSHGGVGRCGRSRRVDKGLKVSARDSRDKDELAVLGPWAPLRGHWPLHAAHDRASLPHGRLVVGCCGPARACPWRSLI